MLKRSFDIFGSLLGIIFLLPLFCIVSIAIKIKDGKPVFFKQKRVGKNGILFDVYKFRTMQNSPDRDKKLASTKDLRITALGKILRHYKLDELPQLFNVLRGDMSFVGYRPEIPYYVEQYNEFEKEILKYKPGIVDPATLKFSREENDILEKSDNLEKDYVEKILPEKISISLVYAKEATFFKDLQCLMKCMFHLFS